MKVKNYLNRVANGFYRLVIKRAWPIYVTPLAIYLALLTPFSFDYFDSNFYDPDFHIRASGFILQLLFVVILVIDIVSLINEFKRPGLIISVKKWFRDFYFVFIPQTHKAKINDMLTGTSITASGGHASLGQTDLNIEQRIEILENRLKDYIKVTDEKIQGLRADLNELRKVFRKEKQIREQEIKEIEGFVERISTKGLKREGAALVWLIAGLIFTIFPEECTFILNLL